MELCPFNRCPPKAWVRPDLPPARLDPKLTDQVLNFSIFRMTRDDLFKVRFPCLRLLVERWEKLTRWIAFASD